MSCGMVQTGTECTDSGQIGVGFSDKTDPKIATVLLYRTLSEYVVLSTTYSECGPRLEEFIGIKDPLIVGAQQRAGAFPGREAHSAGHLGPPLLFTNGLKATFSRHNLKHKYVFFFSPPAYNKKISALNPRYTISTAALVLPC